MNDAAESRHDPAATPAAVQPRVDQADIGRLLSVTGQVQGVGFRPFVYQLAHTLGLSGEVNNDASGVQIRLWGSQQRLDDFERLLLQQAPPMALIESVLSLPLNTTVEWAGFRIGASGGGEVRVGVTPDAAVCHDCLYELFDASDRRYRYPFINCTNCGPRYSLIQKLPYDRLNTTMAKFKLCSRCASEYADPLSRRFHAQPNACPDCGPRLSLYQSDGQPIVVVDPIVAALDLIYQGKILAIKGIGGFHLVCDAQNTETVAELRCRKHRGQKPFALMAANPQSLQPWVMLNQARVERLQASDAPIVLCPILAPEALPGVAPKLAWIGVMLPHSPLHYLLFHQAAGRPSCRDWLQQPQPLLLVMTSANPCGEPLVTDNDEAFERLGGLADAILLHDRKIQIRCDDSVVHGGGAHSAPAATGNTLALIRRGRGLAPQVISLPECWADAPSVLATGALMKNTVCLTKGNRAYVSQHIGDLDNPSCCRALQQTVEHLCRLFEIEPRYVVHDLHPDNFASQFGQRFAQQHGLPTLRFQHHQAHIAAVVAEHSGLSARNCGLHFDRLQPVLGLALDGFGLGDDGTLWGGELLRLEGSSYKRLGHLCPLAQPGADRAAVEPWRMAASALHQLARSDEIEQRFSDQPAARTVMQMLRGNINCPLTSSAGRLFDTVAGILGIQPIAGYEAQPAMMLEGLAQGYFDSNRDLSSHWSLEPPLIRVTGAGNLNTLALLERLFEHHDQRLAVGYSAALLHRQLIDALASWVELHNRQQQLTTVVLSGGCFLNQLLSDGLEQRLQQQGLIVLRARKLPCNDGGLSLGQAWLALAEIGKTQGARKRY